MARPEKVRLGEILVQQKLLSEEQLQAALADQKRTGRKLGRVFVESGFVTEEQISGALARQLASRTSTSSSTTSTPSWCACCRKPRRAASARWCWKTRATPAGRPVRSDRPVRLRRDRAPG
jgi:endonuclease YncB( thermonuclease family)